MRNRLFIVFLFAVNMQMFSQTYVHDEFKMQQFLVGETGGGALVDDVSTIPPYFYSTLHSTYKKSANAKGKQIFRKARQSAAYEQREYSDSIKSYMKVREEQELFNIADRELDAIYLAGEGSKLSSALMKFKNNIESLSVLGGTTKDKEEYTDYYNMYSYGVKAVHSSVMPNNERSIAYRKIYKDICDKNHQLIKYMVALRQIKLGRLATQRANYKRQVAVTACLNRWRSKWIGGSGSDSTTTNK